MIPEEGMYPMIEREYSGDGYIRCREVPLITKKIDLVVFEISSSEIIAIEVKVSNWKRALQQALYYRLCADRTFVALWHEYIHRIKPELFKEKGIGLLEVNGEIIHKIDARRSHSIQKSLRRGIEEHLGVYRSAGR